MPFVTLTMTVFGEPDTVTEYLCDVPDCEEVATVVLGVVRDLRLVFAVCERHARPLTPETERH